ncbi:chemotaxis protein [Azospirillum sp. ST 5-10]|uniref:chemotaxis protein n=1 Tax=unclassified Azospirillum TaxID=2630922 RepID=UPI003F4A6B81
MTVDSARRAAEPSHGDSHYDPHFQAHAVKVVLGRHRVSDRADLMMVTTLGSCVAACVCDPVAAVGGMNHFLLPEVPETEAGHADAAARYGAVAMERLINDVLARGGRRSRLEVKLFGGARVIRSSADIGLRNAAFAIDYVLREGLALVGHDLGGRSARRVHYFPHGGRALRRLLRPEALSETVGRELRFLTQLAERPVEGDIDLFVEG